MLKLQVTLLSAALVVAALAPSITAAPIPATHTPFFAKRADASFIAVAHERESFGPLAGEKRSPFEDAKKHDIWGESHGPEDPPLVTGPQRDYPTDKLPVDTLRGPAVLKDKQGSTPSFADLHNWKPTFGSHGSPSDRLPTQTPQYTFVEDDKPKPKLADGTTQRDANGSSRIFSGKH